LNGGFGADSISGSVPLSVPKGGDEFGADLARIWGGFGGCGMDARPREDGMRACGIRLLPSPAKVAGAGRRKPRGAVVARI
jgi:hypothetical protein